MSKFIKSPFAPFLLIPVLALVLFGLARQVQRHNELNARLDNATARLEKAEQQNEKLARDIESFRDSDVIEREARQRLNLKKEGENVVVILPGDAERRENRQNDSENAPEKSPSLWDKIKSWFVRN